MTYAACYLRRSAVSEGNPGDISRESQEAAIRAVAERDGYTGELRVFEDWGRSGDEAKIGRRTAYAKMLTAIERGEVSVVFAYALDRLARSTQTFGRLLAACKARDVRIVTGREGDLSDSGNVNSWVMGSMFSMFAEFELRTTKLRNGAALARRKARGDKMAAPYGQRLAKDENGRVVLVDDPEKPLGPLLAAYEAAGSVQGACRILDAAGTVRPRHGGVWQPASLSAILERAGVLPPRKHRTHFSHAALLAGLVRCPCGRTMTPDATKGGYYCSNGARQGFAVHGRYYASEARLLPLIKGEANRWQRLTAPGPRSFTVTAGPEETIDEQQRQAARRFADGTINLAAFQAELARITEPVPAPEPEPDYADAGTLPVDWTDTVDEINRSLRTLWSAIELDADMSPAGYVWRKPEWRSA